MKIGHSLLLFCLLLPFTLSAADCPWPSHFEFDGRLGSYREGAGVVVWSPVCQRCNRVTFVQAQAGNYRDLWTGNFGVGHRQLFCPTLAWGVNGFGDVSYSSSGHVYGQGSLGLELLGACWEGRINGYFTSSRTTIEENIAEDSLIINGNNIEADFFGELKEELAYLGFDTEIGRGICFEYGQLWGYAGFYYFHDHKAKDIYGPRVRLEYQLDNPLCWYGTRLTVGGEYFYDPVHKSEGSLLVSFRIPLCRRAYRKACMPNNTSCLSVCRQMGNRVRRESTVWVERIDRREFREEVLAQIFFVDERVTPGPGTQPDPTTLQDAVNRAGQGDFIFLLNNAAHDPIDSGAGVLVMKADQTVLGFGDSPSTTIDFGPFGVLTITDLIAAPHRATLMGNVGSDTITLANRATVRGIQIDGGDNGIIGTSVADVLLFDITTSTLGGIRNVSDNGILLTSATNPTIRNVSVADVIPGNGLSLTSTTSATLEMINVERVDAEGIRFDGGTSPTLTTFEVDDAAGEALSFNGTASATVSGGTLLGASDNWLFMDSNTGTFTFDSMTIGPGTIGALGTGVAFGSNMATTTFINSLQTQVDEEAFVVSINSAPIDATGLTIDYMGSTGASVVDITLSTAAISFGTVSLTGVTAFSAMDLSSNTGAVSFDTLTIDVTGVGIESTSQTGLFTVTSGIVNAMSDPALFFDTVNTDLTFTTLTSISSPAEGIRYLDVTGDTFIASGTITGAADEAILVSGGDPDLNYRGSITNTAGAFITIEDTTGGTVTVQNAGGSAQTIVATAGDGVMISNLTGTASAQIFDASLTGLGDDSFDISSANEVIIKNFATTIPAAELAVSATDVSVLELTDGTISAPAARVPPVISVVNTDTPGTISFEGVEITAGDVTGDVVEIEAAGDSALSFLYASTVATSSMITAGAVSSGVHVTKSGVANGSSMLVTINDLTSTLTGTPNGHIFLETDATLTNGDFEATVINSSLSGAVSSGIMADLLSTAGSPVTATLNFSQNTVSSTTVSGILVLYGLPNASSSLAFTATGNSLVGNTDGIAIEGLNLADGAVNAVITNNTYTGGGTTGYVGLTNSMFAGTFCTTFTGNSVDAGTTTGISLTRTAGSGPFTVTPTSAGSIAADLVTANPGITPATTDVSLLPAATAFTASQIPCLP